VKNEKTLTYRIPNIEPCEIPSFSTEYPLPAVAFAKVGNTEYLLTPEEFDFCKKNIPLLFPARGLKCCRCDENKAYRGERIPRCGYGRKAGRKE